MKTVTTTTKWLAGLNGLLGLWLIAVPFVFSVTTNAMWNAIVIGILIAALGGYNFYLTTRDEEVNATATGANTLLGLWVVVAPFVFNPGTTALYNDVIVGALVAIFAGYNTYVASGSAGSPDHATETHS